MRTKKLGYSDLELTTIGLGTWAIGGPWEFGWGPQDDNDSLKSIFEAMDEGINWIDTAPMYGHGHSEKIIGKALKDMSERPIIATKCGLRWDDKNQRIPCLDADSIREECEDSLLRLGVEAIDLFQIHRPINTEKAVEAWTEIAKLIKQGKVRYGGVSNFTVEQIQACQQIHPVASSQPAYSMLVRDIEDELLSFCAENEVGIVAYSPMARGLLTGKFSKQRLESMADDDNRKKSPHFQEPTFSKILELVEKLKPIAERNGKTLAQLAIAWVLRRDEITSAIVGARRPGQIVETAKAGDWILSSEDTDEIEGLING